MPMVGRTRPGGARKDAGCGRAAARAVLTALCATALVAAVARPAAASAPARPGLFHSTEKRSSKIDIFKKWSSMIGRYARDRRVEAERCRTEGGSWCTFKRWRAFLQSLQGRPAGEQMRAVNAYTNRVRYVSDRNNYGTIDYWATPRQFFDRGGDCEDFAIAKYMSLRALGWSQDRLRIAIVIDRQKRQAHAVLIAYQEGDAYVLDNQSADVLPDRDIGHYHPVYSINERYWWFHLADRPASR